MGKPRQKHFLKGTVVSPLVHTHAPEKGKDCKEMNQSLSGYPLVKGNRQFYPFLVQVLL